MNYKLKSLIYLFAFILSALVYYQVENAEDSGENNNLPELTLDQSKEDPGKQEKDNPGKKEAVL